MPSRGVLGKKLSNPIPDWLPDAARGPIPYGVAEDMNTPAPDPGEEFHHVNTQLFGILDEANRGQMEAQGSYNVPGAGRPATMDGFVADYATMLLFENGRMPSYDEYAKIMSGYGPEQMPVMPTIARGFATFDHWFCEVPSCAFPNRSFFHAGTSCGHVVDFSPVDAFPAHNPALTLFDQLDQAGLSWRVYCDPPCHASLTGVIHAARLRPKFATHFLSTAQFFEDAERGNLPTYSFMSSEQAGAGQFFLVMILSRSGDLTGDSISVVARTAPAVRRVRSALEFRGSSLVNLANSLGTCYLLYFLTDKLQVRNPDAALLELTVVYLLRGMATTCTAGRMSDHWHRRRIFVAAAAAMQAFAGLLLGVVPTFTSTIVGAAFMGGFGAYMAVDQALVTQVLPNAHARAKDLGIISIGTMVPPALAPLLAGAIITSAGGHPALFTLVGAIATAAAALDYRVRTVRLRRPKPLARGAVPS